MSILFVLENYHPRIGGVETLFKSLVDELASRGYACTIITTWPGKGVPRRETDQNLRIIRFPVPSRYLFTLLAIIPVLRQIRNCDIVHTTSYNAALPAWIGARLYRRPVIITFHEVWGKLWFRLPFIGLFAKWGHYVFEKLILRLPFDQIIAPSRATSDALKDSGVPGERIRLIYPGLRYDAFDPPVNTRQTQPAGGFTFTFFGRLGISKGLDLLLPAFTQLKTKHPDARLQLIIPRTPKSMLQWVKKYLLRNDLEDHVTLFHHLTFDALKRRICDSGCVVIPSYSEGFCFVAVESIALGIPVISSHKAALQEVVGGKFILMQALDERALVVAMQRALAGRWDTSPVRIFRLQDTIARYAELYEEFGNAHAGTS